MYVKPAPGMQIRDPDLKDLIPAEGREVPETMYWQCRLRDGDVVPAEPPRPVKAAPNPRKRGSPEAAVPLRDPAKPN